MKAYFDTAILLKIFCEEENSDKADALVKSYSLPILFTPLHEVELKTSLRNKCARGEISQKSLKEVVSWIDADIRRGKLEETDLDWKNVFRKTELISKEYAAKTFARTLDILHVASACILKVKYFCSFDKRQRLLAGKMGLKVRS